MSAINKNLTLDVVNWLSDGVTVKYLSVILQERGSTASYRLDTEVEAREVLARDLALVGGSGYGGGITFAGVVRVVTVEALEVVCDLTNEER